MGDRGNIGFIQHTWNAQARKEEVTGAVFVYTHWAGYRAQEIAKGAIDAAKGRWGDQMYATRIALTHLLGDIKDITGWGVSIMPGENSYPLPLVDFQNQTVAVIDADAGDSNDLPTILAAYEAAPKVSFADFIPRD